jgi:hypothetical protein
MASGSVKVEIGFPVQLVSPASNSVMELIMIVMVKPMNSPKLLALARTSSVLAENAEKSALQHPSVSE